MTSEISRLDYARIPTNGITLNVAQAGPEAGPLVILLHGFPESSYGWRSQIGPLAGAGFRVLAPDQRGYGSSDKPRGLHAYSLDTLVDDLIGLIDASGRDRAVVIGHDWGGIVVWRALARHPSRFDRAVIVNGPHPEVILREIRANPGQLLKSWYTLFFQIPWVPEKLLARKNFRWLVKAMERSSRPGTFSEADFEHYRQGWSEQGAIRSMVNWYRAGFRIKLPRDPDSLIPVPTLILWGEDDRFLGRGVARSSYAQCEQVHLEWIELATHWVQHEQPDRVNRLILEFLSQELASDPTEGKREMGSAPASL
jgi:pimeloyl-ACP methyl ester carboxylesterase